MRFPLVLLLLSALVVRGARPVNAQSTAVDSATIYAEQARELGRQNTPAARSRASALLLQAAAVYRARGDSLRWARALASAGDVLEVGPRLSGGTFRPEALPSTKQAAVIFLALGAKSEAGDAYEAIARMAGSANWPRDSMLAYRARALDMRRATGDRVAEARLMAVDTRFMTQLAARRDAAQKALALARAVRDPLAELLALNAVGLAYRSGDTLSPVSVREARTDTARRAYLEGVRLAERVAATVRDSAEREVFYNEAWVDLSNLMSNHQGDSAVHYAAERVRFARRIRDTGREATAEASVANLVAGRAGYADSAQAHAARALVLARMRADTTILSSVLGTVASIESRLGFADSAIVRYREAEQLARISGSPTRIASAVMALATAHAARNNVDSAMWHYRRMLDSTQVSASMQQSAIAVVGLAERFAARSQLDSAERYFRRLAALSPVYRVDGQLGLARTLLERGRLDSAAAAFETTLRTAPADRRGVTLSWLSLTAQRRGLIDSAMALRRASYAAHTDPVGKSTQLSSLGFLFRQRGVLDSALIYHRRALELDIAMQSRDRQQVSLKDIASVFMDADNADSALTFSRRSLELAMTLESPLARAGLFNNIGNLYLHLGQTDSARIYLERALRINRESKNVTGEASNLTNLALLRMRQIVDDSTFLQLHRAIALRANVTDRAAEIVPRLHLARAYGAVGRHDSAVVYARGALALASATGFSGRVYEGRALAQMGRTYALLGMRDSARTYFAAGIVSLRRQGMTRELRMTMTEMAELFRSGGNTRDLASAIAYYDSAAAVIDDARRGAGGEENEVAMAETQVDVFGGWARAWVARGVDVGASRATASALGAVERGRAQSLVDMLTRLQSATRDQALSAARPAVGSDLAVETDSLLAPLRASGTAALTYLLSSDTLFTWLLTPAGALELQRPTAIAESELNRLVQSSRRLFQADDARSAALDPDELSVIRDSTVLARDANDDWKRLADLLLPADLSSKVPAGTPIVVVPHGAIGLVPFSALATKADSAASRASGAAANTRASASTSLGTRNPLRYAPSFAALRATGARPRVVVSRRPAQRAAAPRSWSATRRSGAPAPAPAPAAERSVVATALVVGNPAMPYVYSGRWTNRSKLRPLPGAEAESRTIANLLGAPVLTGKAATETAIRARMAAAPLIHFATHGLAYGTASGARRSFVAFAPDSTQDGLLTLGELMDDQRLRLRAELVVLSACQTGLGDMKKAEGSIGLQRAFLAKGARSVLVSLWSVDDRATRLLMEKFYAYWLDPVTPRTKAKALQMAQDAVRRTPGYASPKYWAAFQLVGAE